MNKQAGEGLGLLGWAHLRSREQQQHRCHPGEPLREAASGWERACAPVVKTSSGEATPAQKPADTARMAAGQEEQKRRLGPGPPKNNLNLIASLRPARFGLHSVEGLSLDWLTVSLESSREATQKVL